MRWLRYSCTVTPGVRVHLDLGEAIAFEHVHAGDEEAHVMASVAGGQRQGLNLAEIGTGCR